MVEALSLLLLRLLKAVDFMISEDLTVYISSNPYQRSVVCIHRVCLGKTTIGLNESFAVGALFYVTNIVPDIGKDFSD
jgi:hypothetical protein